MSDRQAEQSCAICRKAVDGKYMPFCSKRCADVDLNRWLSGSYAIPGEPVPLGDDDNDEDRS
ncbi:DNA gyrase inhibitor YacG [Aquisalinus flavus]|uniref:DNA gyrase inhibitor YacG n=1 Tax=Aquisalinus flavus TaxID=1526572 RepID=A0A8J2Y5Q6_9PROT|nr:DNA gyrase inhibitor YacG [Aquisalinus flavus]MBD0427394.1 DNA gyrase inhibitor YacG [Aquisalinus flavus]UNE47197.1 DNA gyrase inhibitor YacG [Aquisalinus flavus]GGD00642.1 DNA gyrase inhibitor YacG [Aquisalinus flavus]